MKLNLSKIDSPLSELLPVMGRRAQLCTLVFASLLTDLSLIASASAPVRAPRPIDLTARSGVFAAESRSRIESWKRKEEERVFSLANPLIRVLQPRVPRMRYVGPLSWRAILVLMRILSMR